MATLRNPIIERAVHLISQSDGKVFIEVEGSDRRPKVSELGADVTTNFHTVTFAVQRRWFRVFWNGRLIDDVQTDFDLTPGKVHFGARGEGRVECARVLRWGHATELDQSQDWDREPSTPAAVSTE